MAFQAAYGLLVDGVCGPVTMAKILEDSENKPKPKAKAKSKAKKKAIEVDEVKSFSMIDVEE